MGVLQTVSAILYALGSLVTPLIANVYGVAPVLIGSAFITVLGVAIALALSVEGARGEPLDLAHARLLEHQIFAGLPAARLETAARQLLEVPMATGSAIVRQGEAAERFYLIGEGSVSVTQVPEEGGAEVHLRNLGPGDVFGEIGLLRRSPRTATVTATSPGLLLALDADAFRDLVGSGPGLSTRLLDLYRGALTR